MGLAVFRDISLLWLIFLTLLAVIPIGVLFFFAIKGLIRLRAWLVLYLPLAQEKARLVSTTTARVCDKIAAPIVYTSATAARVNGLVKAMWRRKQA